MKKEEEKAELVVNLTPLGLGPWSHSKKKCLYNCPFQFYLKYVLKIKPDVKPPMSLVTEVGKAAHRICELVIGGKSVADSFKLTRKEYTAVLNDELWAEHVDSLEFSVMKFKERMDTFDSNNKVKRFLQEIKIGVNANWEPTGFFAEDVYWRGVIDLVIQMENGDVIYIDHKTGAPSITGIKYFIDQLDTYKVLFHYGIEKTNGAQAGVHFIRDGEMTLGEYSSKEDIEGSLKTRLEFSVQGAIDKVKELGYFKHIRAGYCSYCDFNAACKAGELKSIEMDSKKWFEIKEIK